MVRRASNVVFLGATKGMGRALARRMAERGDRLFLLGRDLEDLRRSAGDLSVRSPVSEEIGVAICDLERPDTFARALQQAETALGSFDIVVVTAAQFATQDQLEMDTDLAQRVLTVDFAHTVTFCEHARKRLIAQGGGTLCVFSSVAGERGRKRVVLYGAAKAGLSRYLEGLDHRYRAQGLITLCVKPGFVTTSMTEGLPRPPFASDPDVAARHVLAALDRGQPVVYVPPMWGLVMSVIRLLPRFVMRRLDF
jgi:decaprenylphospho-beta-D-erythro-pentofuranosid-2-ulose 2-reductase